MTLWNWRLFYSASRLSALPFENAMRIDTRVTTSQLSVRIVRALATAGALRFNELDRAANAPNAPSKKKAAPPARGRGQNHKQDAIYGHF
jgi:hypothetical protein